MSALILAVFVASVLGSGHCVGMCGPFVALSSLHPGPGRRPPLWRRLLGAPTTWSYQAGRLVAYATLGAGAGLAGSALDRAADLVGIQQAATRVAGLAMLVWGSLAFLRALGWTGRAEAGAQVAVPWLARLVDHARRRLAGPHAPRGAFLLGAATSLMPCGWLYAFVVTAAGTASIPWGMATMAAFWLGTVPALHTVAVGVGIMGPRLRSRLPVLGALLVMGVGLFTVLVRAPVRAARRQEDPAATCHHAEPKLPAPVLTPAAAP